MAEFAGQYNTRDALITALGTLDYLRFTTNKMFDGVNREYIFVPSLSSIYARRTDGRYRVISFSSDFVDQDFDV